MSVKHRFKVSVKHWLVLVCFYMRVISYTRIKFYGDVFFSSEILNISRPTVLKKTWV